VNVGDKHALAQIVEHDDARSAAQPAKGAFVQLGPDARAGAEGQQTNRLAAAAQRHHEQPGAPVLAALGIAHHGTGTVINLRLLAGRGDDDDASFRGLGSAPLAHEALHALVAAGEAVLGDQVLPDGPRALRPRLIPNSMASRYGSQALEPGATAESGITSFSLAGFEVALAVPLLERFSGLGLGLGFRASGTTGIVGFAAPESVITSLAGFDSHRPQPLGGRTAIPAAFKWALAVSRRILVACWMRRSDQPSRPRAKTCCFFSSFKTLAMPTEPI